MRAIIGPTQWRVNLDARAVLRLLHTRLLIEPHDAELAAEHSGGFAGTFSTSGASTEPS